CHTEPHRFSEKILFFLKIFYPHAVHAVLPHKRKSVHLCGRSFQCKKRSSCRGCPTQTIAIWKARM
ncbi:MAG: hypothetical protein ACI4PQ_02150, partial [Butyricicoccaceae bacterium]